ncbi:uncharacterized protein LOC101239808 isoform X4 [Hydra vulgaris]|uniref:uncharacterized protein LOC101239808 isoform X4 n=1 Tax=Hydra vulgaris TaxID=6087 RepID=UPI0032E9D754
MKNQNYIWLLAAAVITIIIYCFKGVSSWQENTYTPLLHGRPLQDGPEPTLHAGQLERGEEFYSKLATQRSVRRKNCNRHQSIPKANARFPHKTEKIL